MSIEYALNISEPFKSNPYKMVKHTQTIRWQQPINWLSVFDHFMELALKTSLKYLIEISLTPFAGISWHFQL